MAGRMIILTTFIVLSVIAVGFGGTCKEVSCRKYEKVKIVPDVIPKAPSEDMKVSYGVLKANYGNQLSKRDTRNKPSIEFDAESNKFYTLAMIDPDAPHPDNPKLAQFLHWLVVNIPGNDVPKGNELVGYKGPSPPAGPAHRYILLAYQQADGRSSSPKPPSGRTRFDVAKFAENHSLTGPIAGNFYLTSTS